MLGSPGKSLLNGSGAEVTGIRAWFPRRLGGTALVLIPPDLVQRMWVVVCLAAWSAMGSPAFVLDSPDSPFYGLQYRFGYAQYKFDTGFSITSVPACTTWLFRYLVSPSAFLQRASYPGNGGHPHSGYLFIPYSSY